MGYRQAHAPIYGYMRGFRHTIPLHLVHYARTFSIFRLLNTLDLGSVLNVGGADGCQSHLVRTLFGKPVTTVDIDEGALAIARERFGLEVALGSALDLPFAGDSFDTVLCIETIEHIRDPGRVVAELTRVARRNVIVSTESFFDSEEQKRAFLLYIRETHPQFFRERDPVTPGDVSYFTREDFHAHFGTRKLRFLPQFSSKQAEIIGSIEAVREHVRDMTENIQPDRRSKVIVHYSKGAPAPNPSPLDEDDILRAIVTEGPLFPMPSLERDEEMLAEDEENLERIARFHEEKAFCAVTTPDGVAETPIEETGAVGMSMRWLTRDDLERSPRFCTRLVTLAPGGRTPERETPWEHQLHILSGKGLLVERTRETELAPGATVLVREGLGFRVENAGDEPLSYLDIIPSITHYFGR
ncbi:methyltransferase domain-containing protein [Fundidesulfovibrio soli]|uniref:methyltransferase domain-containing protein n=1 Tax=Fundidesulfovibrio soli TaxID=2922716 RepID=UPI001FAE96AB|nr:methyltransferase domain-containing protein [Fundidesulfovibrio soli]